VKKIIYTFFVLIMTLFLFAGCSSLPGKKEFRALDTRNKAAEYLKNGTVQFNNGRYDRALELFQVSYRLNASIDHEEGIVAVSNSIGKTYILEKRFNEAKSLLDKAMKIALRLNNRALIQASAGNLADYFLKTDKLEEAEGLLRENLSSPDSVNTDESALLSHKLALLLRKRGEFDEALLFLQSSLKYNEKNSLYKALASDYYLMASIHSLMKDYEQAEFFGKEALRYDKMIEFSQGIASDLDALSTIMQRAGKEEEASVYAERYERAMSAISALNKIDDDSRDASSGE